MDAVVASLAKDLAVLSAKKAASGISALFTANRLKKNIDEMCNSYEEIINELIQDRSQAIAIAQAYQAELERYTISDDDIKHLHNTIAHALNLLSQFSPDSNIDGLESISSLISVDTLKAMQLLGFNYKTAIGEPLTNACAEFIEKNLGSGK
ncbi:hypothetical protein JTE88_06645 [Arcanobacterium phocisimile]|uniref:Uncharacterized protein n=1 Tax=Arcanobacterium phocisimile TaxID=1302235 RepID=A0ABX7IG12_9ACTO|nr:hypothetical protein [Arcanobacterium phocisimile]QRV01767.1 hypothetical protein JTE88_06645 [Arcanobacterium phocisimile]